MNPRALSLALTLALLGAGCDRPPAATAPAPTALDYALAPHAGDAPADRAIRRAQEAVRSGVLPLAALEQLGWAYVAKARESVDPGYHKLAEACADAMDATTPGSLDALLLRGHVLHNLHRFREAEEIARRLATERGLPFDHALLGDVLMEQGRLDESLPAYQRAMDLRPDLHAYVRVAHVRWLIGDLEGAIEAARVAVGASDPASAAATCARLAALELQAGDVDAAAQACAAALRHDATHPPALLVQGRLQLARDDVAGAIESFAQAAERTSLPDAQWALADALRLGGREAEATRVEETLRTRGVSADPRTLALFLATRGEDAALAVALAEQELAERQDVFTRDALAWALAAAGRLPEAQREMDLALAEGTADARLFLHAAVIAARAGEAAESREWAAEALRLESLLLPSERAQLRALPHLPAASSLGAAEASKPEHKPSS